MAKKAVSGKNIKIVIENRSIQAYDAVSNKFLGYIKASDLSAMLNSEEITPILPNNVVCAKYRSIDDYYCYVYREYPGLRRVNITMDGEDYISSRSKIARVSLDLPYVYFFIHTYKDALSDLNVYLSNKEIKSIDEKSLTPFNFFNCPEGRSCLGKNKSILKNKSLEEMISIIPRIFWESNFNLGLEHINNYNDFGIDFKSENPVKEIKNVKGNKSIKDILYC